MRSQEFLSRLMEKSKYIQENIEWSKVTQTGKYQKFKIDVLSGDGDYFQFNGILDFREKKVCSLALVYNREFALVRIDKKHHKNPEEVNSLEFLDWHKHKYDPIWEDQIAIDVSHEFNDNMTPGIFIEQFKEENKLKFLEGKSYQKLYYE